tara:strand:+ start:23186 stop:23464 length:279 start_codon:yes stop_codon:yes gene_type:complete
MILLPSVITQHHTQTAVSRESRKNDTFKASQAVFIRLDGHDPSSIFHHWFQIGFHLIVWDESRIKPAGAVSSDEPGIQLLVRYVGEEQFGME